MDDSLGFSGLKKSLSLGFSIMSFGAYTGLNTEFLDYSITIAIVVGLLRIL
jgi:hypothetical protein